MTRLSIRWRLTLWYGAALAAILMIFSAATYWRYRAAATAAFDADLVNNLEVLQGELVEELSEAKTEADGKAGDHADVERSAAIATLENFRLNAMYAEIRRGSRAETVLARLPGGGVAVGREIVGGSTWSELSAAPPATRVLSAGPRVRAAIRAFQPPGDAEPLLLVVAEQTTLVDQTLGSIRRSLIEFGAVGLLLALAGGYWLATRALRPIDLMTTQARDMAGLGSRQGLRRLDVANPGDELGRLALTFNRLLERIESSVTQMKDFVADAAHELKTPVSIVRTEAELSLSANRSVDEYRESLGAIARESEQLSNLVRDLTLLAEGETLEYPLERRLVDLNELIHEVVRSLRGLAGHRRVSVAMEPSGGIEYRGDERLLRQTFTNLVENAIKFSREGGRVGICVQEAGGFVEVRVLDEAPTLPASDRERVFERFYRAQQSRSSDVAGSGLGLAIVRWAVGLHGGHVRVEGREGSGNVFVVILPTFPEDRDRGREEPVIVATKRVSGHALGITLLLLSCAAAAAAQSPAPVTIEEAIQAAHAANARLPLSSVEVSVADARRTEALAEKWLKVAVEGDFYYAPAGGYDPILTNLGDARLQAVVRQPLYAGGRLKAGVERADADVAAAHARYRIAEKDLDLEIRSRYAEWLAAEAEVAARREGIERLSKYRTSLGSRQASGQGVATDVLRIEVRMALEEAAAAQAEERQDEARLVLNERMGRDPGGAALARAAARAAAGRAARGRRLERRARGRRRGGGRAFGAGECDDREIGPAPAPLLERRSRLLGGRHDDLELAVLGSPLGRQGLFRRADAGLARLGHRRREGADRGGEPRPEGGASARRSRTPRRAPRVHAGAGGAAISVPADRDPVARAAGRAGLVSADGEPLSRRHRDVPRGPRRLLGRRRRGGAPRRSDRALSRRRRRWRAAGASREAGDRDSRGRPR